MTRPSQHRSRTPTQTVEGNWSWWGKRRRCTHAYTFCRRIWEQGSAHMYILRGERGPVSIVCLCVWRGLRTSVDARWTVDDLLIGGSMVHIEQRSRSVGLSPLFPAENAWISSTSRHVLSWCSLQLEACPMHTVSNQAVEFPLLLH